MATPAPERSPRAVRIEFALLLAVTLGTQALAVAALLARLVGA